MLYKKGVAVPNYPFRLLDADGVAVTTGTTTGLMTKDGTQSATLANATHVGSGMWNISFTADEMNGDSLHFLPVNASAVTTGRQLSVYTVIDGNLLQINGVTLPVDNLEAQYDGTGLSGESYPATQGQVSNIAVTGSAVNTIAESYVLTIGTQTANTFEDTHTPDNVRHTHTDTGGALDLYYEFDLTPAGVPTGLKILGKVTGINDSVTVYAYNWITTAWNQVGVMIGSNSAANETDSFDLLTAHVGTGADVGKCRIRFYEPSGLTAATLYIDQLLVAQTYAAGGIANGSTVTLTESVTNSNLIGNGWKLNLGGQDISGAYIKGAVEVSGTATCTNGNGFIFEDCNFLEATIPAEGFIARAAISKQDTVTFTSTAGAVADNVSLTECFSGVAGTDVPAIDVSGVTKTTSVNCRGWTGGLKVTLNSFVTMSVDVVAGGNIKIYGTGGLVRTAGTCVVQDFSGGAVTIVQVAVLNQDSISSAVWAATTAPTVAEFEARTLPAADYFVASDYTAPDNTTIADTNAKVTALPEDVDTQLSITHGAGSWLTGGGGIATDVNIISVNGTPTTSIDDFKATGFSTFNPASDTVANVTTVQTTVTNSDMRGTDNALLASSYTAPDNATIASIDSKIDNVPTNAELNARTLIASDYGTSANQATINDNVLTRLADADYVAPDNATIASIDGKIDTLTLTVDDIPTTAEFNARTLLANEYSQFDSTSDSVTINTNSVDAIWTTPLTESYASNGVEFTAAQALYMAWSDLRSPEQTGTTWTDYRIDNATQAMTFTLNDALEPSKKTRSS